MPNYNCILPNLFNFHNPCSPKETLIAARSTILTITKVPYLCSMFPTTTKDSLGFFKEHNINNEKLSSSFIFPKYINVINVVTSQYD